MAATNIATTNVTTQPTLRNQYIARLLMEGSKTDPVQHWTQGMARALQGAVGGLERGRAEFEDKQNESAQTSALAALLMGRQPGAAPPVTSQRGPPPVGFAPPAPDNLPPSSPNATAPSNVSGPVPQDDPTMTVSPRQVQLANPNMPPPNLGPVTAGPRPPNAMYQPTPSPMPPAPPGPMPGAPPPMTSSVAPQDMQARIAAMLDPSQPRAVQAMGRQLASQVLAQRMKGPKFEKLDEGVLYDQNTGRTMQVGPDRRSLTDPAERERYGIPTDDKRPYQVGPNNRLINPPAENRITVDQRGETAFTTNAAKHNAERYNKLVEGGFEAQSMVADLGALRDIGSRITTGKTAQVTAALGPYAEAVGVKIEGLDDLQAYQAIVSRMAPRMRVAGSGATSDFEMRQFLQALPQLGTTPQGNEMITNTLEALQQHRMAAADIGSRALAGELPPREAEKLLRDLPNPLELWKRSRGGQAPSANPSRPNQGRTKSGIGWSVD